MKLPQSEEQAAWMYVYSDVMTGYLERGLGPLDISDKAAAAANRAVHDFRAAGDELGWEDPTQKIEPHTLRGASVFSAIYDEASH